MLSDADEEFLTQLHRNCELRDIGPGDERYVPLERYPEAVGPDSVRYLSRSIARTSRGSVFFLSGLRGSGKTTQLARLQIELRGKGFAAVRIDAEQYLNLRQPVDIVEFLFFLVGGIADAVDEAGWAPEQKASTRAWERLRQWLQGLPRRLSVRTEAELGGGFDLPGLIEAKVNLKAEIARDESFVAELRRFLDGRLSELAAEANSVVEQLVRELRDAWPARGQGEWLGLVVLVDSLDHVRGSDFLAIRRALVDLFDKQARVLTLHACTSVFIVPPYLHPGYGTMRKLTNIKVADRDRVPFPRGIEALREVVTRRFPDGAIDRMFTDEGLLEGLLLTSGGNLRDLLRLVTEVATQAESLPVDATTVTGAIAQIRNNLLPLSDDERAALARVAEEHRAPLHSQDKWSELSNLFDRHLVLGYSNGETWYDVHPLIADEVNAKGAPPDEPFTTGRG
ncbi:MAG TPA: hypothetical protein VLJ59_12660 [Mycobacteriales bacterium]|nr:hypothetical protein [Mycobacteriales bacterium]